MKALVNGKLILEDGIYENQVILIDEKIRDIFSNNSLPIESNLEIIDVKGSYIAPGLIDIHIHGAGGKDTMDGTLNDLEIISSSIIRNGVTAFLPTTMTMEIAKIHQALKTIRLAMSQGVAGAKILGAHLEGPFINPQYKGAQKEDYIISPNLSYIKPYLDILKIITLAPETEPSGVFLKDLQEKNNIVISIGHSNAQYEEAMEAIEKGISHATHLFNGMPVFHHRKPGVVGAVFNSSVTCELIADKVHVHPAVFSTLLKIKEKEKIILITDSIRAGGMQDGEYDLGGQKVVVSNGICSLEDGTIAGSILTLNKAINNFYEATQLPLHQVVKMASLNPALLLKIDHQKGSLQIGKDADITVFDHQINIKMTIIEGELKYENICDE